MFFIIKQNKTVFFLKKRRFVHGFICFLACFVSVCYILLCFLVIIAKFIINSEFIYNYLHV